MEKLIHILFEPAGEENLLAAIGLDDILAGETAVFTDDLSAGPLREDPGNGPRAADRAGWNRMLGLNPSVTNELLSEEVLHKMNDDPGLEAWIWAAPNPRDLCGYYHLAGMLGPFPGRTHIIYLNNLPFINEKKSVFYPINLSQIPPREFLKARALATEISTAGFEAISTEWQKQVQENAMLRTLEGSKGLLSLDASAYDTALLTHCSLNFQKALRIAGHARDRSLPFASIPFLLWRIRELSAAGILESVTPDHPNEWQVRLWSTVSEQSNQARINQGP
ncbi:MAG TPA: DUF3658 domain-containing protein [Chitinophagaceae bacterium]|nr:DUF3658 domain-containing protein [Chitinophagaceae bacterium]